MWHRVVTVDITERYTNSASTDKQNYTIAGSDVGINAHGDRLKSIFGTAMYGTQPVPFPLGVRIGHPHPVETVSGD